MTLDWGRRQKEAYFVESVTDSRVVLMPTGPLPEPVINGGMEEKVRAANT